MWHTTAIIDTVRTHRTVAQRVIVEDEGGGGGGMLLLLTGLN